MILEDDTKFYKKEINQNVINQFKRHMTDRRCILK